MPNPFIEALRAAFVRLAQEDVDIRSDLMAAIAASSGVKRYANLAAVAAVTTSEIGIVVIPEGTDAFGDGMTISYTGEAFIRSMLADGAYNDGGILPPVGSGFLTQVAEWSDGYGGNKRYVRTKFYDHTTQTWAAPGSWIRIPVPDFRPSSDGVFYAGATGEGFRSMVTPASSGTLQHEPGISEQYVAQHWAVMMSNLEASFIESGKLDIRSASAAFQGILDGTATDYGTRAFVARSNSVIARTGRLEWTAPASAVGAIAGVSIPFGYRQHTAGWALHATFGLTGGVTANTRLLCGLASAGTLAAAMSDVDPSGVDDFIGVGFGSADAKIGVHSEQIGVGARNAIASTVDVPTAADTRIDLRMFPQIPNGSIIRIILAVRRGGAPVVTETFAINNASMSGADLVFFLRASAGATAAQPKVSLYRLRAGVGMFSHY